MNNKIQFTWNSLTSSFLRFSNHLLHYRPNEILSEQLLWIKKKKIKYSFFSGPCLTPLEKVLHKDPEKSVLRPQSRFCHAHIDVWERCRQCINPFGIKRHFFKLWKGVIQREGLLEDWEVTDTTAPDLAVTPPWHPNSSASLISTDLVFFGSERTNKSTYMETCCRLMPSVSQNP